MVTTKEETAKNEKSLKTFQEQQLCDLEKKHKQSFEELEKNSKESLTKQAKELEKGASEERERLLKEREEMAKEKEEKLVELQKLYEQSCCQVERLSGLVQESNVGLGSASTRISSLNNMIQQKQTEINSLQKELTISVDMAKTLQVCVCCLPNFYSSIFINSIVLLIVCFFGQIGRTRNLAKIS